MDGNLISVRKQINALMSESKRRAKKTECIWCGTPITSFCNSHSVPRCILKNIEIDGKIDYYNSLVKLPHLNADKGVNEAGVFKLLCRSCDNEVFKDYENLDNLRKAPSDIILAEIALKNILVMMNKRFIEREMHRILLETKKGDPEYINTQLAIEGLDIRDYEVDYWRAKKAVQNKTESKNYRLIYWKKLNHKIPIAFQGLVTLYGDLEGKIINDVYDNSESLKIQNIHICLFPLEEESIVCLFCHQDDHNYDGFISQFNSLTEEERLQLIGYILFARCEDMLLAKHFPHRTWILNEASDLFKKTPGFHRASSEVACYIIVQQERCLLMYRDKKFPNIFDAKFAFSG